jgi:hypothetical protein
MALFARLWLADPADSQTLPFERVFHSSKREVDEAVRGLGRLLGGRLPILEGFVEPSTQSLDHYERGYYQCVLQVTPDASGGILVRVSAKITAWYADPNSAQSGYHELPSNGRLETDLLDRLEGILAGKTTSPQAAPSSQPPPTSGPTAWPNTAKIPAPNRVAAPRSAPGLSPSDAAPPAPPAEPAAPAPATGDLASLKQRREEAEKRMKELINDVRNLEEILHGQAHPGNLVVVRKSGTPVFSKPQANAPVLFSADAQDEFEMLERQATWIHVQISGLSRGWIRRAQLDLPEGRADSTNDAVASDPAAKVSFRVTREETNTFAGDWEPLRGKSVRVIWVEASERLSSPRAKREFAKSLLRMAYKDASSADPTVAGIVIVFDSADGGQIAATLANVKKWQAGELSEVFFWQHCSLDPPESFQE